MTPTPPLVPAQPLVPTQPLVEVRKVWKAFGEKRVLRGVSFALPKGTILAVMGGSGQGKTVLLRIASGLAPPDAGEVRVFGTRIDRMSEEAMLPLRRRTGFVFQGAALFDSLTVFENVAFPLREHTRLSLGEITDRVHHFLDLVGLPDTDELLPAELSGGMRKRVGIARAIALRPRYILYDEPTTGLDPVTSAVIDRLMVRTREHLGVTGVVVTHDMRSAYTVGDRIAMLYEGRIRQVGSVEEIQRTEDPVVRQFIEGRAE